jgi:hypothetical protein
MNDALSPDFPLGASLEVFVRRADAERFIEEVRETIPSWRRSCGSRSASSRRAGGDVSRGFSPQTPLATGKKI